MTTSARSNARITTCMHLACSLNAVRLHACWRRQIGRSRDQNDFCPTLTCRLGNGIAHLARRRIGDKTHRIDRLLSRPCRHQHRPLAQIVRDRWDGEAFDDPCHNVLGLNHAPLTDLAAGQDARSASMTSTPNALRRAMLLCTIGLVYILVSIAGARITGAIVVSRKVDSRSSAMPLAYLPMMSAVVGATRTRSQFPPSRYASCGGQPIERLLIKHDRLAGKGLKRQGANKLAGRTSDRFICCANTVRPVFRFERWQWRHRLPSSAGPRSWIHPSISAKIARRAAPAAAAIAKDNGLELLRAEFRSAHR